MSNLFIVVIRYISPIEEIDLHRSSHLKFLDENYEKGFFLLSGPQNPRNGGIIFCKAKNREYLVGIFKQDPFNVFNLAEYQIFEFAPNKFSKELEQLYNSL